MNSITRKMSLQALHRCWWWSKTLNSHSLHPSPVVTRVWTRGWETWSCRRRPKNYSPKYWCTLTVYHLIHLPWWRCSLTKTVSPRSLAIVANLSASSSTVSALPTISTAMLAVLVAAARIPPSMSLRGCVQSSRFYKEILRLSGPVNWRLEWVLSQTISSVYWVSRSWTRTAWLYKGLQLRKDHYISRGATVVNHTVRRTTVSVSSRESPVRTFAIVTSAITPRKVIRRILTDQTVKS